MNSAKDISTISFNKVSIDDFINENLNIHPPNSNLFFCIYTENYSTFKIIVTATRQEHLVNYLLPEIIKKHSLTHVFYDNENGM